MLETMLNPKIRWIREKDGMVQTIGKSPDAASFRMECSSERESPEILLDFGRKVTGYVVIRTGAHSGDYFSLKYGPVEDCLILPLRAPMPYGGVYESEHYIACRYLRLSLSSDALQPQRVFAEDISVCLLASQYPVAKTGAFTCEDPDLNLVFERGAYTLELCMQKNSECCWYRMLDRPEFVDTFAREWKGRFSDYVIYDAPRRDRETWLGDLRAESLLAHTAFGAYDVVKNTLSLFYDIQRKDGTIPGSGSTWMDFLEFAVWGIIASWECYVYSGDHAFLEYMAPYVRKFIAYTDAHADERGFLFGDGSWCWTLPREGYNAGLQVLFTEALRCTAAMERALYNEDEAIRLENLREMIRENIQKEFWDEEAGIYRDTLRIVTPVMPVLLDVNCYAVVFGLATKEQAKRILAYARKHMWCEAGSTTLDVKITEAQLDESATRYPLADRIRSAPDPQKEMLWYMQPHNKMVWPFVNAYEVEARFLTGDTEGAFELIRRCWDTERFAETGTYWEIVDPDNPVFNFGTCVHVSKDDCYNSAAHGFSGWVAHLLQAYVLGVKPQKPGFAQTSVRPQTGPLRQISGAVPTPSGLLRVRIEKTDEVYTIEVIAPRGVQVSIDLSEQELGGRRAATRVHESE